MCLLVSIIINYDVIGMDKNYWKKKIKIVKRDFVRGIDLFWLGN